MGNASGDPSITSTDHEEAPASAPASSTGTGPAAPVPLDGVFAAPGLDGASVVETDTATEPAKAVTRPVCQQVGMMIWPSPCRMDRYDPQDDLIEKQTAEEDDGEDREREGGRTRSGGTLPGTSIAQWRDAPWTQPAIAQTSPQSPVDPDAGPAGDLTTQKDRYADLPRQANAWLLDTGWILLGVAAATAVAAGMVARFAPRRLANWLGLGGPLLGLFSRINEDTILQHKSRRRVAEAIEANPGVTLPSLATTLGLAKATVSYHLNHLKRYRIIYAQRLGKTVHYYRLGHNGIMDQHDSLAVLQRNPTNRIIAAEVIRQPGVNQARLRSDLGLYPSRIHERIKSLQGAGLIRKQRQGRTVRYFPTRELLELHANNLAGIA